MPPAKASSNDDILKEFFSQVKELKKTNPDLATALATIPKNEIVKLVKVRASVPPPSSARSGPLVTPAPPTRLQLPATAGPAGTGGPAAPAQYGPLAKGANFAKKGLSKAAKIGAGVGLGAGILIPFFSASPITLPGRTGKAKELAVKGFAALGASSSSAALAEIVRQQELAARRQVVMQTYEPDMFNQVLNVLANTGAPASAITSTERQIGSNVEQALPARRPDKDVKFLLDQLLAEASGS